ncbi:MULTISPECIES: FkbM family methyltransferase [Synechococcales]|uniref:FkbM family methyltransferase n=1 Tax=Synechococcus sp. CS-1324 TaxID=2847980 RepID=UPI00223B963A|nr:FkbM family methyltransferase [Synechococcus sp. CS-1324]
MLDLLLMRTPFPYGLRKIWSHPSHCASGGLRGLSHRLGGTVRWATYQLQKKLSLFPATGRVIPWVDGLKVQLLTNSQGSQSCLYYGLFDWPSLQFLRRYLRPGDLCADIGANMGTYRLLMARWAGAQSVHAFECLPENVTKLRCNLKLNGLEAVTVHPVALADRDGLVQLNRSDGDSTVSISPPPLDGYNHSENGIGSSPGLSEHWVQAKRLDGFPWPDRFAYIKIDVEGAEQLVLGGSEGELRRGAPKVWSFELLDTQQRLGSSNAALLEAFTRWQYGFYLYDPTTNRLQPFCPETSGAEPPRLDNNVLAIHVSALEEVAKRLCGLV